MRTEKIVVIGIKVYQFLLRKGKASTLGTRHTGGLLSQPGGVVKRAAASTRGHSAQLFPDSEKVF